MLNIKKTISFAALVGGLLIIFAAPRQASAQFVPPGSYQKSCSNIKTAGVTLSALCNTKDKQSTLSKVLGAGKPFEMNDGTSLENYFECEGSIWNDDGVLKCNRNTNNTLIQAAKKGLNSAYKFVYGTEVPNDTKYMQLITVMFARKMEQKFYGGKYGVMGLADGDLIDMLKAGLSGKPAAERRKIIEDAYTYAYGRGPGAEQIAPYINQTIGYREIIQNELKLMKSDNSNLLRGIAITNAYKDSMGRTPTAAERSYWNPKLAAYREIVEASRAYMYSPNGSKDLLETIKRALKDKNGKEPDSNQLADAVTQYSVSKKKPIYDEMK